MQHAAYADGLSLQRIRLGACARERWQRRFADGHREVAPPVLTEVEIPPVAPAFGVKDPAFDELQSGRRTMGIVGGPDLHRRELPEPAAVGAGFAFDRQHFGCAAATLWGRMDAGQTLREQPALQPEPVIALHLRRQPAVAVGGISRVAASVVKVQADGPAQGQIRQLAPRRCGDAGRRLDGGGDGDSGKPDLGHIPKGLGKDQCLGIANPFDGHWPGARRRSGNRCRADGCGQQQGAGSRR